MRTFLSRGLLGLTMATLVLAAACGYDPNPESGTLKCGPMNSCPDNYSCMNGACWRNGAAGNGSGHGGTGGTGGSSAKGGSGGSSMGGSGGSPSDKFIGTWNFDAANTTRVRVCTDGTNETMHPYADSFVITAATTAALSADFYCPWNLDLTMGGTTTMIRSGQSCSHPDPTDATVNFTWRADAFTLMTTNGTSGTADLSVPYSYTTSTGSGSCTMHFTGPVTKQ
jgi:hypothetical protein